MSRHFDENLYQATLRACIERKVPDDLASKLCRIVATDDPSLPNLGRTPEDTQLAFEVLPYFQK